MKKTYKFSYFGISNIIKKACEEGMLIQRSINDKYDIPATRIKNYSKNVINELEMVESVDKKPDNFVCQKCKTNNVCNKYCEKDDTTN